MHLSYSFFCLLLFWAFALSAPVPESDNLLGTLGAKIKLVRKNRDSPGQFRRRGSQEEGVDSASLEPDQGSYLSPITIGGQPFNMVFDTGSQELWVLSTFLNELPEGPHNVYDPTNSKTAISTDYTFNISYGEGTTAIGQIYKDTVNLAGLSFEDGGVGAATTLEGSKFTTTLESDGLLGLSFAPSTAGPQVPTTLDNLACIFPPSQRYFTSLLTRESEPAGYYTFGAVDEDALTKTPCFTPIIANDPGYWLFESTSATINGKCIERPGNTAFADTGTTLIYVSDDIVEAIYKPICGELNKTSGLWQFPASLPTADYPQITLPVGDAPISLYPGDFALAEANSEWLIGTVQSRGNQTTDVFGDKFLINAYTVWDFGTTSVAQIGVVQRNPGEL